MNSVSPCFIASACVVAAFAGLPRLTLLGLAGVSALLALLAVVVPRMNSSSRGVRRLPNGAPVGVESRSSVTLLSSTDSLLLRSAADGLPRLQIQSAYPHSIPHLLCLCFCVCVRAHERCRSEPYLYGANERGKKENEREEKKMRWSICKSRAGSADVGARLRRAPRQDKIKHNLILTQLKIES